MVTTRKLLFIAFILILIITTTSSICFADTYDNSIISVETENLNVQSIQDYTSGSLNGYKSVFSRFSSPRFNLSITSFWMYIDIVYSCSTWGNDEFNAFTSYLRNDFDSNLQFRTGNNTTNNLVLIKDFYRVDNWGYTFSLQLKGDLTTNLVLNNQLLSSDFNNDINTMDKFGIYLNLFISEFTYNGFTFKAFTVYSNQYNYNLKYTFNPVVQNINGAVFLNTTSFVVPGSMLYDNNFLPNETLKINNVNLSGGDSFNKVIYFNNNSSLSQINLSVYMSSASSKSVNYSSPVVCSMSFYITPPVLFNQSQDYIDSSSNENTNTPLKLNYYDCEWYEIHLQLANAFIFMITELPIVSDVTNVIFVIINLIKNSLDVLLQFSSFGIVFAFGMFAVVLGLLIRLFMGGE